MLVDSAYLTFIGRTNQGNSSRKDYRLELVRDENEIGEPAAIGWGVRRQFGRIGQAKQTQFRAYGQNGSAARREYESVLEEKLGKGYQTAHDATREPRSTLPDARRFCQAPTAMVLREGEAPILREDWAIWLPADYVRGREVAALVFTADGDVGMAILPGELDGGLVWATDSPATSCCQTQTAIAFRPPGGGAAIRTPIHDREHAGYLRMADMHAQPEARESKAGSFRMHGGQRYDSLDLLGLVVTPVGYAACWIDGDGHQRGWEDLGWHPNHLDMGRFAACARLGEVWAGEPGEVGTRVATRTWSARQIDFIHSGASQRRHSREVERHL